MQSSLRGKKELFNVEIGHSGTGFDRKQHLERDVENKNNKGENSHRTLYLCPSASAVHVSLLCKQPSQLSPITSQG